MMAVDNGLAQRDVTQAVYTRGDRLAIVDDAVVERLELALEPAGVAGDLLGAPGTPGAARAFLDLEDGRLVTQERRGERQAQPAFRRVQRELHPVPRDA